MDLKKILVSGLLLALLIFGIFILSNFKMVGHLIKSIEPDKETKVLLKTNKGDILIQLYSDKAPITVENFLSYVKDGSYEGTVFHRVIKGFMIQGGGYTKEGIEKSTKNPIKLESGNGLKNEIGTIAMARTAVPDSATNQFFINTADNAFLNKGSRDDGYAVFGKIIKGMDVVTKIESSKTSTKFGMSDWPIDEVIIIKAEIV